MEREIKEALFWWLEKRYKNKTITTEVAIKKGNRCNIADMVMATRDLYAFEIKGPKDTLRRLPAQIDAYTQLFDYVYVVYWRGKFKIDDDRVGLIEVYKRGDRLSFRLVKKAPKNGVDPSLAVHNLFRSEMRFFLKKAPSKATKDELGELLLRSKTPKEIIAIYKTVMRYRYKWGYFRYKLTREWSVFQEHKIRKYLDIA